MLDVPKSISDKVKYLGKGLKKAWHALESVHTGLWIFGGSAGAAALISKFPSIKEGFNVHPFTISITFALIMLLVVFLFFVLRMLFRYMMLFERVGIVLTGGYHAEDKEEAGKYRILIRKLIDDDLMSSKNIRILGATGFNTFAAKGKEWQNSPPAFLYETLENVGDNTQIDVILLHPASEYVLARVAELKNITAEEYRDEIYRSIQRCGELKENNKKIRCFLYKNRPMVWKLIISDNYVWQQAYPHGSHVEFSSVNLFKRNLDSNMAVDNSLYSPFARLFDLLRDGGCEEVNLEDVDNELINIKAMSAA